jgi:hypothetical protein
MFAPGAPLWTNVDHRLDLQTPLEIGQIGGWPAPAISVSCVATDMLMMS